MYIFPNFFIKHSFLALKKFYRPNKCNFHFAATTILAFENRIADYVKSYARFDSYSNFKSSFDYNVLLVKRPQSLRTFANRLVFPGGVITDSDHNRNSWDNVISSYNNIHTFTRNKSKVYLNAKRCQEVLNPCIALRLCALRELFEETGLLLAEDSQNNSFIYLFKPDEMKSRQLWLLKNPGDFYKIYTELHLIPPLFALKEWSNWITPPGFNYTYNTLFYFLKVDYVVHSSDDTVGFEQGTNCNNEVEKIYIDTPVGFLHPDSLHKQKIDLFAIPQLYELSRLLHFPSLTKLAKFATERSELGVNPWRPHILRLNDSKQCTVYVFPGDQRYIQLSEAHSSNLKVEISLSDLHCDKVLNRCYITDGVKDTWFESNFYDLGHITPMTYDEFHSLFMVGK